MKNNLSCFPSSQSFFRPARFVFEAEKPKEAQAPQPEVAKPDAGAVQKKVDEYDVKRSGTLTTLDVLMNDPDTYPETKERAKLAKNDIQVQTKDPNILRTTPNLTEAEVKGYLDAIDTIISRYSKKEASPGAPDEKSSAAPKSQPEKPKNGVKASSETGKTETVKMKLFDTNVDVVIPAENKMDQGMIQSIFQRLEKRSDLKPFISASTQFRAEEIGKLSFNIKKGTESVKYIATPDSVLKVIKDRDPQWMEKSAKLKVEERKIVAELEQKIKSDSSLSAEQRDIIHKYVESFGGDYAFLPYIDTAKDDHKLGFKVSEKYKDLVDRLAGNSKATAALSQRELVDDDPAKSEAERSKKIYDTGNVNDPTSYSLSYENGVTRDYQKGFLIHENQVDPVTGHNIDSVFDNNGKKTEVTEYDDKGQILKSSHYGENGKEISRSVRDKDGNYHQEMVDDKGQSFSTLDQEQKKNPEMTKEKYLDLLAQKLDTPEKLQVFFETFMQYTDDVDAQGKPNDYWQTPGETLGRVEKGKMLGDCDDYASLAKEILTRQGKNPFVLGIPTHAVCVWVEKRPDGRYDAFSLCTFGFDKNGNRFGMKADPEKEKGYATPKDAINSLMGKYQKEGVGVREGIQYQVTDSLPIDDIPAEGKRQSLQAPIEILTDPQLAKQFQELQKAEAKDDYATAEKIYLDMAAKYPDRKFIHEGLALLYKKQYEELLQKDKQEPNSVDAKYLAAHPEAAKVLSKMNVQREAALSPSSKYYDYSILARDFGRSGDKNKQRSTLEAGIKALPQNPSLYASLISFYADENNVSQMDKTYVFMRANCPLIDAVNLLSLAFDYNHVGKRDIAEGLYDEIIAKADANPSYEVSQSMYVDCSLFVSNKTKQKAILQKGLIRYPGDSGIQGALQKLA